MLLIQGLLGIIVFAALALPASAVVGSVTSF
jgi:hypothetical protein